VGTSTGVINFGVYTTAGNYANNFYYLIQGTASTAGLTNTVGFVSADVFPVYFPKPVVIYAGACSVIPALSGANTATFTFYKNGVSFLTMLLTGTPVVSSKTITTTSSSIILPTDYFSVTCRFAGSVSGDHKFSCNAYIY
jgi:hypothetical protein